MDKDSLIFNRLIILIKYSTLAQNYKFSFNALPLDGLVLQRDPGCFSLELSSFYCSDYG